MSHDFNGLLIQASGGLNRDFKDVSVAPDPSTVNWLKSFYRDLSGVNLEDRSDGSLVLALKINGESQLYLETAISFGKNFFSLFDLKVLISFIHFVVILTLRSIGCVQI